MARVALIKPFTGLNLGVAQLSGELQRAGHESRIIFFKDFRVVRMPVPDGHLQADNSFHVYLARGEPWSFSSYTPPSDVEYALLIEELRAFGADLVGISVISAAMSLAAELTARIKAELPIPVVWGGVGATLESDRALEHADVVCVHEGEETIVEMANAIDAGRPLAGIAGTWARGPEGVVRSPARPLVSLDAIAVPDFEPVRTMRIEDDRLHRDQSALTFQDQYVIMTTRGCPFSCSFCIESVYQDRFGKKGSLRRRSVDRVIRELVDAKEKLPFDAVYFFDDVFTTHRAWLEEFSRVYPREVGLPFWCYTYPTTTRREDVTLLRDAGCASMTMGVQSGSPRLLAHFDRPTPIERVLAAAEIIIDAGVRLFIDVITMSEYETEEDAWANVDLFMRLPRGVLMIGLYPMIKFPTYGYSERVAREGVERQLGPADYEYFHKLYFLALSSLPERERRAAIANPAFRRDPKLLDPLLPSEVFVPMIDVAGNGHRGRRTLDTTGGQGVLPPETEHRLPVLP